MQVSLLSSLVLLLLPMSALAGPLYTVTVPAPAASSNGTLEARDQKIGQHSGLTIYFWGDPSCGKVSASMWSDVTYNSQMYGMSAAYTLSRDLLPKEIIDVSTGHNMDTSQMAMTEAVTPAGGQYPGPGWKDGGWVVPSACDTFLEHSPYMAQHLNADGSKRCYVPKKVFNCGRLWMKS